MRYYVIINGINSLTIPGLAIKDLPPISKTLMRNQKEEIDGRDGDIITELGYSAYDKTMTIGLYGSYDINQIIAFFNQKGTIVFSDEPDKYYNFTILDQIDYDKLVKFRTATIRIHCQPFKYPVSETPVEIEAEYVTAQGEEMALNDTGVAPLEIGLKGNTHQETTTGKNLLPTNSFTLVKGSSRTLQISFPTPIPAGTYTLSCKITNKSGLTSTNGMAWALLDSSTTPATNRATFTQIIDSTSSPYSSTKTTNGQSTHLYIYLQNVLEDTATITLDEVMLEQSATATSYEPYTGGIPAPNPDFPMPVQVVTGDNTITISNSDNTQSQEYEINLGTLELCKIGNYQDYFYKDSGKWYKKGYVRHLSLAIADMNNIEDYAGWKNVQQIKDDFPNQNSQLYNLTNYYMNISEYTLQACAINTNSSNKTFYLPKSGYNDLTQTQWMTNYPNLVVELYYGLQTPYDEEITNTELIEQLETILNAVSYEDQTNISQENDNLPFILDVSALKKGTDMAVVNNGGNIAAKPIIAVKGNGTLGIYLDNTQMFSLNMTSDITIDTENMEAYDPNTNQLRNRQVTGDYSKFALQPGNNTIKVTGDFTSVTISKYERYL